MDGNDTDSDAIDDRIPTIDRRRVLGALGVTAVAATAGCTGGGGGGGNTTDGGDDGNGGNDGGTTTAGRASIHPSFGYSGTGEDAVPDHLSADHTVGLHVDEEKFIMRNERPVGVRFGAFHFEQAGLHVEPGDVVKFELESPDHTVTALHPGLGRQQRVPDGVPWFSSPVIAKDGFWLYEFGEPGVYDLICAPHEMFGMAMRVVVGEKTEPVLRSEGRPPAVLSAALIGTGIPGEDGTPDLGVEPLAPDNIVEAGSVRAEDLPIDLAVPVPRPTDPSKI